MVLRVSGNHAYRVFTVARNSIAIGLEFDTADLFDQLGRHAAGGETKLCDSVMLYANVYRFSRWDFAAKPSKIGLIVLNVENWSGQCCSKLGIECLTRSRKSVTRNDARKNNDWKIDGIHRSNSIFRLASTAGGRKSRGEHQIL